KMGFSTIPAGGVLFRMPDHLHILKTDTAYLTSETQHSLAGTRSGAAVASAYAVIKHLGRRGYETIIRDCMRKSDLIVSKMRDIGIEPLMEPVTNVVVLDVSDADDMRIRLRKKGWEVSITRNPRALRLVVMPHLSDENIELFMDDVEAVQNEMNI
ncbi:MAG: tyrosine decarboxylase MfnA, partial [Methanosarcinales archaeon]|nr:tyrosine decarboxylase MfnA [Methanosarcinales archaeon]